jgi:hypothetical protein
MYNNRAEKHASIAEPLLTNSRAISGFVIGDLKPKELMNRTQCRLVISRYENLCATRGFM